MTPNPGSAAHERLLDRWLDDLQVLAARLEQVYLERGFTFDYTPASLAALEHALVEEEPDDGFRRAATSYIREVLMDVCGGRWDIDPGTGGGGGDPVVRPDPALGLPPLSIGTLIDVALAERSGEVFTRERAELAGAVSGRRPAAPGWGPRKERSPLDPIGRQSADGWLRSWLADRQAGHPSWVRQLSGAGSVHDWDFSPAGLDALERQVRGRYSTLAAFDADHEGPFLQGPLWYLGQILCLYHDSTWVHWAIDPDAPRGSHQHADNPWSGIPFTLQPHTRRARPCDPLELLRGLFRYGPGYHLSGAVAEM
ncbi:hypothetical protein ACN6LA_003629 [Streptomyces sp. SAS_269]|uniref:hypothetical protein n=1 Tax=Streptomyces sp. SAS_269 TaxID=3412749 RepID=UPI00403CCD24